jgi:hypothetical protein
MLARHTVEFGELDSDRRDENGDDEGDQAVILLFADELQERSHHDATASVGEPP